LHPIMHHHDFESHKWVRLAKAMCSHMKNEWTFCPEHGIEAVHGTCQACNGDGNLIQVVPKSVETERQIEFTRALHFEEALTRIANGTVCVSYEYDPAPTEKEIALSALQEAQAKTEASQKKWGIWCKGFKLDPHGGWWWPNAMRWEGTEEQARAAALAATYVDKQDSLTYEARTIMQNSAKNVLKANPFLKWVGGKRQLVPELLKYVPSSFGRYYEPFLGGGALFFELHPRGAKYNAVLADTNARLIRTYSAVRSNVHEVIAHLRECKYEKEFFYAMRAKKIDSCSDVEVAAWLIYLNKTCFNGLYRVNRKGEFNVPFGKYDHPTICDAENLHRVSSVLGETYIRIIEMDFERALELVPPSKGDFIYFDPPYAPLSATSSFTGYTAGGFGVKEQTRLRDVARRLKDRGVHVLLSNSSAPLIRDLYKDFEIIEVDAKRSVNSKAEKRGNVKELILR
jgi:DNA adenine methylase